MTGVAHAPHKPVEPRTRVGRAVRRARERSVVRGYKAATAAIGKISPRISMSVGKALFVTGYFAWPKKRRIILLNASHVLGLPASDYQVRHLARRIYASYAAFVIELMRMPQLPADEPLRVMRAGGERGEESFTRLWHEMRDQGRGMVVVSGHIGSIELLAGYFALRGRAGLRPGRRLRIPGAVRGDQCAAQALGHRDHPVAQFAPRLRCLEAAGPAGPASRLGLPRGGRAGAVVRRVDDAPRWARQCSPPRRAPRSCRWSTGATRWALTTPTTTT